LLRAVGRCRVVWLLLFAGLVGSPAPVAAQSISPLEFGPMLVWDGYFQYRLGWKATWSAPLAKQFFSVDASWPRPPIGLTEQQRCDHSPYTSGGIVSVELPSLAWLHPAATRSH
jgi:hypothetical protein